MARYDWKSSIRLTKRSILWKTCVLDYLTESSLLRKVQEKHNFCQMKLTKMKELETKVMMIDTDKMELDKFSKYSIKNKIAFLDFEKKIDILYKKVNSLANWIEFYMPLRLQQLIT